jgi:replicative DNA helicase
MNVSEMLLSAVLLNKDQGTFFKINENWLRGNEEVEAYSVVLNYYRRYGKLPSLRIVEDKVGRKLDKSGKGDSAEHFLEELKNRDIYYRLAESIPKLMKDLKKNPRDVLSKIKVLSANTGVDVSESNDGLYSAEAIERYKRYELRVENEGVTHLSSGDVIFDKLTMGWNRTDLVTLGGRSGVKKSWWICVSTVLTELALPETAGPLLLITNEMSREQMNERIDAIRYKLPWDHFLRGKLTPKQEGRYRRGLLELERTGSRIITIDTCYSLDDVHGKVQQYKPAAVFIDGSYLLEPKLKEGHEKTTFITRNLKQLAMQNQTPFINTTQLRKKTGKKELKSSLDAQDEFYYGSYVQDSDIAIYSFQDPDMKFHNKIGMQIAKGRNLDPNIGVHWMADLNKMTFKYELTNTEEEIEAGEVDY